MAGDRRLIDLKRRFSFGVNLDDPWRYSGIDPPKSIVIPHLLSVSLPEGRVLDQADEIEIRAHGESEPTSVSGRAALALTEALVEAGIDFVRCWFPWKYFEPSPVAESSLDHLLDESYSKWPMDNLVNTLSDRGIAVVPVLACGYQRMLPEGLEPDHNRVLYLKRASVHARLLVRHYRDRVKNWQIENEPNWWTEHEAGGWRSGLTWVDDQRFKQDLLSTLNNSVHTEDPNASTIINLEADSRKLDPSTYAAECDIIGLDFYPNYKRANPINPQVTAVVEKLGKTVSKPMMIMETGYPSGPSVLGYSPENQARYVEAVAREAFDFPKITGVGIWRYIDTSWKSFPPQENHFGLLDNKGVQKQAWTAYSKTIKELK